MTITPGALHAIERIYGWSISEDSSAAAHIELREVLVTGKIVAHIGLASDTSESVIFPKPTYVECPGGVWVNEEAGSIVGVLYY
jgi:hypothetical protein